MTSPSVSVIVAVLNEVTNINHVIDTALLGSGTVECIVADGGSTDGTIEALRKRSMTEHRLVVLNNADGHQSVGLNMAAAAAKGDILVRLDGHTQYAPDYVDASVAAWEPETAVGGPMVARGSNGWQGAVANAMGDALAIGPARFHHAVTREVVDTVYLGSYSRAEFRAVGGYRTFRSGTVEDTDFYSRWRQSGRTVIVDPTIRSLYEPRATWSGLWTQYFRYGQGKAELLRLNGRLPSIRPLAPALLVVGLMVTLMLGPTASWIPFATLVGAWALALLVVGTRAKSDRIRTSVVAATMHLAYGWGFWVGLFSRDSVFRDT